MALLREPKIAFSKHDIVRVLVLHAQVSVTQSDAAHARVDEKPVKQNQGKLSYYSSCVSREV